MRVILSKYFNPRTDVHNHRALLQTLHNLASKCQLNIIKHQDSWK